MFWTPTPRRDAWRLALIEPALEPSHEDVDCSSPPSWSRSAILVAVHEFGHYWVAKKLGFKVLRFSIGFGKPLLMRVGKDADRTEYCIAAIPLGGYVKLLDEREGEVSAVGAASLLYPPAGSASHRGAAGGPCDESAVRRGPLCDFGDGRARKSSSRWWDRCGSTVPAAVAGLAARAIRSCASAIASVDDTEELQIALIRQFTDEGVIPLRVRRDGGERSLTLRVAEDRRAHDRAGQAAARARLRSGDLERRHARCTRRPQRQRRARARVCRRAIACWRWMASRLRNSDGIQSPS